MAVSRSQPSAALAEANERLLRLQAEARARRQAVPVSTPIQAATTPSLADMAAALPAHLGWGSGALTVVLRRRTGDDVADVGGTTADAYEQGGGDSREYNGRSETAVSGTSQQDARQQPRKTVKLYPDIGLGMLRQEQAAAGRLWLLLQHLDPDGRGVVRIDIAKEHLTKKTSTLRLCGWRQLRNLLRQGQGVFWQRDRTRIWLRSAAKAAANLGVERLSGRPVALPIKALLSGVGQFRAELYAAFHSGRTKETPQGETRAQPIARETLARISGVGETSQRTYEARTGLTVQRNYAVGEATDLTGPNTATDEQRTWRQGTAVFPLRDHLGQQGRAGRTYLAWQLPNSYLGGHKRRPKGRQKRINRALKDLVKKGTPGNVGEAEEERTVDRRRYYVRGKDAVRVAARGVGKRPQRTVYWRSGVSRRPGDRLGLWQPAGGD